jgi:hypothetical protein
MKVSWDNYSQYMESHKIHVPNHQPDYVSTSACTWHESNHQLGYLAATICRCSCSDLKTVNCAGLLQLLRILGQKQLLHARSSGRSGPGSGACFGFGRDSATFVCFGSRKIRKSNGIAGVFSEYSDIFRHDSRLKNLEMMPPRPSNSRQDSQLRKGIVGGDHGREGPIALAESLDVPGNHDKSWLEKQNHSLSSKIFPLESMTIYLDF